MNACTSSLPSFFSIQVAYVIVNGHKKDKTTQMAEDPEFARSNGLKLNRLWYFEHAIEGPVRRLFAALHTVDVKRSCDKLR